MLSKFSKIQTANAALANWIRSDVQATTEGDRIGRVNGRFDIALRKVAVCGVEKTRANVAVGLDNCGYPRGVATNCRERPLTVERTVIAGNRH